MKIIHNPNVRVHKASFIEHSHTHLFVHYSCFSMTRTELGKCGRDLMACKTQNICHLTLYKKSCADSSINSLNGQSYPHFTDEKN